MVSSKGEGQKNYAILGRTNLEMMSHVLHFSRNLASSFSHAAPTKLVPWSLQIVDGLLRRAMICLSDAINPSVVRSETSFK